MIGVRRDKDVIFSREKEGEFERYVDQMQDPVEGRVISGRASLQEMERRSVSS